MILLVLWYHLLLWHKGRCCLLGWRWRNNCWWLWLLHYRMNDILVMRCVGNAGASTCRGWWLFENGSDVVWRDNVMEISVGGDRSWGGDRTGRSSDKGNKECRLDHDWLGKMIASRAAIVLLQEVCKGLWEQDIKQQHRSTKEDDAASDRSVSFFARGTIARSRAAPLLNAHWVISGERVIFVTFFIIHSRTKLPTGSIACSIYLLGRPNNRYAMGSCGPSRNIFRVFVLVVVEASTIVVRWGTLRLKENGCHTIGLWMHHKPQTNTKENQKSSLRYHYTPHDFIQYHGVEDLLEARCESEIASSGFWMEWAMGSSRVAAKNETSLGLDVPYAPPRVAADAGYS